MWAAWDISLSQLPGHSVPMLHVVLIEDYSPSCAQGSSAKIALGGVSWFLQPLFVFVFVFRDGRLICKWVGCGILYSGLWEEQIHGRLVLGFECYHSTSSKFDLGFLFLTLRKSIRTDIFLVTKMATAA